MDLQFHAGKSQFLQQWLPQEEEVVFVLEVEAAVEEAVLQGEITLLLRACTMLSECARKIFKMYS